MYQRCYRCWWRFLFTSLVVCIPGVCVAEPNLYELIQQRLQLMKDVAAYKHANQLPVEDLAREAVVLQKAVDDGLKIGLTVASSRSFFAAQIDAAKDIQTCWMTRWRDATAPADYRDLTDELRPALLQLGAQITAALRAVPEAHDFGRFARTLDVACLSERSKRRLFETLGRIDRYPDRLAQITDSGQLRIGTTGDYAPFSYSDDGKTFVGIDIDLAKDLALSLGVTPIFVQTSWPTLTADLQNGHFDVAMSGVSRTIVRAKAGYFSATYHTGGKTPISRCEDVVRFDTLSKIDRPGVTLVVNPGGTNERFLDRHIRRANKKLHDDNRTVFDVIVRGDADLMITDAIEVALKSDEYVELCPAMPGELLTYQEKGYFMPKDESLRHVVDMWLAQRRGDGTLARVFATHLNRSGQ